MNRFSDQRGFAMLEVMIGVAVVSILAMIVVPKVSRALDTAYVDYEIRCLHSTIQYAQSVNRLTAYRYYHNFSPPSDYNTNSIVLVVFDHDGYYKLRRSAHDNKSEVLLRDTHYLERDFKFGSSISLGDGVLSFNPDGLLTPARSFTLYVRKGDVKRALVLSGYGRVRIDYE